MASKNEEIKFNPTILHDALKSPECREYFEKKYHGIMGYYWKFLKDAGPNCSIVQAALVAVWREEMESVAESFQASLRTGNWGSST